MQLRLAVPRGAGFLLFIRLLGCWATVTSASTTNVTGSHNDSTNLVDGDAQSIVRQALRILAAINKDRIDHPVFNKAEYEDIDTQGQPAEPLDYEADPESLRRRLSSRSDDDSSSTSYSIPPELAEAARIVAESTPQQPQGDHDDVAATVRNKYARKDLNDTNTPREQLAPEGLLSKYAHEQTGPIDKRDSGYWMIDDQSHPGKSPFSPSNYQVWRNVKNFGAVGDGITDDTEAINRAISDGARCGSGCHTSTIAPAVVYFPPGTYLVSSSIIQYYNTQFLGDVSLSVILFHLEYLAILFCFLTSFTGSLPMFPLYWPRLVLLVLVSFHRTIT